MISHLDIVGRLLVAALFGSLIGFERERLLWAAGIRTHMMVSVGSALLMIVSAYGFTHATRMETWCSTRRGSPPRSSRASDSWARDRSSCGTRWCAA